LTKKNGSDLGSILKGKFNTGTETAHVYIDASRPPFIIIGTDEGLHVMNDQTREKTETLYKQLESVTQE
jgi:hypothetical protein